MKDKVFEAFSELEEEAKWCHNDGETLTKYDEERFNVIRQALLNSQDLEKFTRLVITKGVETSIVSGSKCCSAYNNTMIGLYSTDTWCLTEDEFNFAKEMIEKYEKKQRA